MKNTRRIEKHKTVGVGLKRALEPECHDMCLETRGLSQNLGNRSRYLNCFSLEMQWRYATVFSEGTECQSRVLRRSLHFLGGR